MKLTARGRTVLAQVSNTRTHEHTFDGDETSTVRTEYALLSDGVIGVKHTFLKPDGRTDHSGGWKVKSKLKPELRKQLVPYNYDGTIVDRWVKRYTDQGFTRTK